MNNRATPYLRDLWIVGLCVTLLGGGIISMTASSATSLDLTIAPRGGRQGPLYPEQTADFDIVLRNVDSGPVQVKALEGNLDTPIVRLFGPEGLLGQYDKRAMGARIVGDAATLVQPAPKLVSLPPGGQNATWVNLWQFHDALPPGGYAFDVVHAAIAGAPRIAAQRLAFEIVPARVSDAAMAYDSRSRAQTELAWLAAGEGASKQRLLLRESGYAGHSSLHQGGTPLGEFENGSRVALSHLAWDAPVSRLGWAAVLEPSGRATAVQFASAFPQRRKEGIELGIRDPLPVPRFPNRDHAVILATGQSEKGPALAISIVRPDESKPESVLIPLKALPVLSACAFAASGPIRLLFVSDDGQQSTIHRIDVDETGKVVKPETAVRTTRGAVVAITTTQRTAAPFFQLLEADRRRHNRMAVLRLSMDGDLKATDLGQVKGWPTSNTPGEPPQPLPARHLQLEQSADGGFWLAFTDERGDLYCGKADTSVSLIREAKGAPALFPHLAAIRGQGVTCSAFTPAGDIFHSGAIR